MKRTALFSKKLASVSCTIVAASLWMTMYEDYGLTVTLSYTGLAVIIVLLMFYIWGRIFHILWDPDFEDEAKSLHFYD